MLIGRTDGEAEAPILWPPECEELTYLKGSCCWERLKAGGKGEDRRQNSGWHHQHDEHEFEQALGVSDGQQSLACCSP